jgi:hypothetical protein
VALANFMRLSLLKGARAARPPLRGRKFGFPAGLMFSGRPYGPGSDLRFIAGYRTDSYGLPETSTLVPSVLYNFGAHSATTRYKNQFPTSHTSLYGNSKIELESDLGPEGR